MMVSERFGTLACFFTSGVFFWPALGRFYDVSCRGVTGAVSAEDLALRSLTMATSLGKFEI